MSPEARDNNSSQTTTARTNMSTSGIDSYTGSVSMTSFLVLWMASLCNSNHDARRLYEDLLKKQMYNRMVIPMNNTAKMTLKLGLKLAQLLDVVGGCCVALRCVALRCVALRCVALRCVALRCVALRCVALRCVALRCVALRCVALRCVALRCVALR